MKKFLVLTAVTVFLTGSASALTSAQSQANALNCVEVVKFAAELSSPSLNSFMLKSKKVVFDKSGNIYIIEKALGDIKYRYLDKNNKPISGKNLEEAFNNARNNAAFVEMEFSNKFMYSAKLLLTYENQAKKHENIIIEGTIIIKSGKEDISYLIDEKLKVKEVTPVSTVITSGILKSAGKFKDMIVIDFSKNNMNGAIGKDGFKDTGYISAKRSQKIDNLRLILAR